MPPLPQARRPPPASPALVRARRRGALALGLLAMLPLVLWGVDADARAGGGEHYSGGSRGGGGFSGGGGSGFSGGGGDGELVYLAVRLLVWLIEMTFAHPQVMVPVWIGVAFLVWLVRNSMPGEATRGEILRLDRSRLRPDPGVGAAIDRLRANDPGFDVPRFLDRTRRVFLEIQEGWFLRRLERERAFMSDGLYRRFTTLLALMAAEGRRDAIADARVDGMDILRAGRTEAFDFITVRVDATLRDVEVPANTSDSDARQAAMAAGAESFTELWTFVRRPDATTRSGYGVGQGSCPNCGAPFSGGAAGKCEYCGAIVNSGTYDWVLSEITQASEYLPHDRALHETQRLRMRDPDFSAELLEDRALLLFWKWIEARSLGRPEALRKLSTERGWSNVQAEAGLGAQGRGPGIALPAVGGADLVALRLDEGGFDHAFVDVRWSAATRGSSMTRPHRHVIELVRSTAGRTDRGVGLANERCGNCLAPLTSSDSTRCDFCGHDFSAASLEWQLESVTRYEAWHRPTRGSQVRIRVPNALPTIATDSERLRLLQLMAAVARADGVVDHSEMKLLRTAAHRWQVPWSKVEPFLEDGAGLTDAFDGGAPDPEEVLRTLVAAARVDGRVDRRERALIEQTARHLHAEPGAVERLLAA
jgi:hypothetical protein